MEIRRRKGTGRVLTWHEREGGEDVLYIRETVNRHMQTVCLTQAEFERIADFFARRRMTGERIMNELGDILKPKEGTKP